MNKDNFCALIKCPFIDNFGAMKVPKQSLLCKVEQTYSCGYIPKSGFRHGLRECIYLRGGKISSTPFLFYKEYNRSSLTILAAMVKCKLK
jgi:hypothetical protein